jgi:hypothetical protein
MSNFLRTVALPAGVLSLLLACSACSKPEPPKKDQPPEPQAQASPAETHTELRDAMQAPINRAKAVEPEVLDEAKKQQADIDAQTGG